MEPPSGDAAEDRAEPMRVEVTVGQRLEPVIMINPAYYLVPAWEKADEAKWGESEAEVKRCRQEEKVKAESLRDGGLPRPTR